MSNYVKVLAGVAAFTGALMPISSSDAQQNVIGNCSQENVLKLIDAGYDKLGIARICGKIPSAAMNKVNRPVSNKPQSPNTSKPSASPPDRTDRVDLATLDGTWGMEVACSPYSGASTTLQASNGLIIYCIRTDTYIL